jgi:hypothetical protein
MILRNFRNSSCRCRGRHCPTTTPVSTFSAANSVVVPRQDFTVDGDTPTCTAICVFARPCPASSRARDRRPTSPENRSA